MLTRIINFSINNKLIIGLFTIALVLYGAYEVTKLPIDAVPDITDNQVQILTQAPSFSATDIERFVTYPIEQANSNIAGLKEIRSFSRFGLSVVTIVFDDATDVYWARQQVAERLQQIQSQIPTYIGTPEMAPVSTGLGEIYQYVIRPKKGFERRYSLTDLRTIQDYIVRRQLLNVKGVAEVNSFGGKLKQYEVNIDPNKLNAYGITVHDVFKALENNNQNTGGAYIEKQHTVLYIRSEGLLVTISDIEQIVIQREGRETPLFLKDVADVRIGFATRYGALCYNDEGEVAGAVVMMLKDANSNEVIKNIKERVVQIERMLPEGIVMEAFLDRTKMVNSAIGTVRTNLLEGALIVLFVLVLFLGNLRAGLLVASVIPLSMLFAVCMMNIFGVSGNLMSLGALDFGLIVDGAVIIVEAVLYAVVHNTKLRKTLMPQKGEVDKIVGHSASKMMNSALFGQLIILVVYLPIFTLQGIEGKMFIPMAQAVVFALLGAFILSLTYIPMMSALLLGNAYHKPTFFDRGLFRFSIRYQHCLARVLRHPKKVLLFVFALLVSSIVTLTFLGGEFIPTLEEGDFAVDMRVLTGSNLNTTIHYAQKAASILEKEFPEVEKVVAKIGSGEVPTDPMPMNVGDMMVILKDRSEWTSASTFNELSTKMNEKLSDIPGLTFGFQYPVRMRFNELMTGARQDVVCKIFGEDLDTLAHYATQLGNIITTINGAVGLFIEPIVGIPQVVIEYDRAMIAQYNLSIAEVNSVVNIAFAGQSAGTVFEGEKRFDLVVRMGETNRRNIDDVSNLLIPLSNGSQIPLSQVARVALKNSPNQIQREDGKRRVVVGFNIKGVDVQTAVQELQGKVLASMKLPVGYFVSYGGSFENLERAKVRLLIALLLALTLIFIILFFAFRSVQQGLMIYTTIPLSIIGGVFFLALRGMPFSISAGIGFIALFGVAVLNGIVLIAEFNRLKQQTKYSTARIIFAATRMRLRPILMTALVASLGFLPMALSKGAGAEVQRPLATVVIGGLIVVTCLTLFVLPLLYVIVERRKSISLLKIKKLPLLLLCFLFATPYINAQQFITLDEALHRAAQQNLSIKSEKLKTAYAKASIGNAYDIAKTNVVGEVGQLNTLFQDTRFGISQSFNFPMVYVRKDQVYRAEWKASLLGLELKTRDVKKIITHLFNQYDYLTQKENLLLKADTLFTQFDEKTALRLQKGETNVLERTTSTAQKGNILLQINQIQQDKSTVLLDLKLMLNSDTSYIPLIQEHKQHFLPPADTSLFYQHPSMQLAQQKQRIAQLKTTLEKSKWWPDISVGYNNTSFVGPDPNSKFNTTADRFHSFSVGLGIPLFLGSQIARVKAANIEKWIADNDAFAAQKEWKNNYNKYLNAYHTSEQTLLYFEMRGLPSIADINRTAYQKFINGDINYLEFVMLLQQAITLESNYLDILRQHNEYAIELNYMHIK